MSFIEFKYQSSCFDLNNSTLQSNSLNYLNNSNLLLFISAELENDTISVSDL